MNNYKKFITQCIRIPINENGETIINWAGDWDYTFKHISYKDIYNLYILRKYLEYNLSIPQDILDVENDSEKKKC